MVIMLFSKLKYINEWLYCVYIWRVHLQKQITQKSCSLSILHSYCVLIKTHMGKSLFSPELKSYSITQWNCTTIGSCSGKKRTNGSAAELHEPMATIPARSRQNGQGIWLYSGRFAIGSSDFFSFSDDDFVYTDPEAYSPLTRLAAGPSDLDLLGWSAFLRALASQQFWSRSLPPSVDSHVSF